MARREETKRRPGAPSNREEVKARLARQERQKLIPIVLIALAAIAVVAILIVPTLTPKIGTRPQARGLSMGDPNAPVKVQEFADFQCPACGDFTTNMEPQIVKDYVSTGKVYFTYTPFSFLGPESFAAAEAAYCAADQEKFWEYHDTLYANQRGENQGWFSTARLTSFASNLNLNVDTFKQCLEGGKYKQKVQDDVTAGTASKINSTPSFLVNGRLVHSDTLDAMIKTELAAKGVK
jgi:protein-disulfide isomerase